jgi:hypothetical protein
MSTDFRIDVSLNGDKYRFVVFGNGIPPAGLPIDRDPPALTQQLLDTLDLLRRGEGQGPQVSEVTATISTWFLGADLNARMDSALNAMVNDKMRLVFNILDTAVLTSGSNGLTLSDLPLELVELNGAGGALVLNHRVSSFVHLLPKIGNPPAAPVPLRWPLRVLLVRSSPVDLEDVPLAVPIRDQILALGQNLIGGPAVAPVNNPVQVDLISREAGVDRLATWETVSDQIANGSYHILIYLGHGDVADTYTDVWQGGTLQLESPDGQGHENVSTKQLRYALGERAPAIVLLVGCVTAQQPPPQLLELIPRWVRGSMGVAQALVNGETGVQAAIGMRYQLDTEAAQDFLHSFFTSLVQRAPGDVEAALQFGRKQLAIGRLYPPSWSAPVMFRSLGAEPMFAFMTAPPVFRLSQATAEFQKSVESTRAQLWPLLAQVSGEAAVPVNGALDGLDEPLLARLGQEGAVLMPGRLEWQPGRRLSLKLSQDLAVNLLKGKLTLGSDMLLVSDIRIAPAAWANGFRLQTGQEGSDLTFTLERKPGADPTLPLPAGILFDMAIQPPPAVGVWYLVGVQVETTAPLQAVWTTSNAIIVPK